MKTLHVGVTGINAIDNPGPGIGVARSLKEAQDLDVKIVGLAYDAMEPGIYMDWVVDAAFILPHPSCSGQTYLDRLLEIKNSYGLEIIIPNLDAELPLYIKHASALGDAGIGTFLPDMDQFRLRGKDQLAAMAEKIGVKLPKTKVVTTIDQLIGAVHEVGLPAMVNGCFYQAYRANTLQEALNHYHTLIATWGYPIVVQQVVKGDELNVVGLGDGNGGNLGLVAAKKIFVTELGKMWAGVTVKHAEMLRAAADFVSAYKWRGPFELECMVDKDDVYLIEVNPRFPAWSYFATGVGINLPAQLLRSRLGLPVEPIPEYPAGKLLIRYSFEMIRDMSDLQKIVTCGATQ
jgi:carbamoyl-phosphate synthase large subunit